MTQISRKLIDEEQVNEGILRSATAVTIKEADAYPRFAEPIAAAKVRLDAASEAVAAGGGQHYVYQEGMLAAALHDMRGRASIEIVTDAKFGRLSDSNIGQRFGLKNDCTNEGYEP
jgi:hypothetical protein